MAIKDDTTNNNANNAYQTTGAQQAAAGQQQQQHRNIPPTGGSFFGNNSATPFMGGGMFAAPMPTLMGSKQYQEMKKKLLEVYQSIKNPDIILDILDLDKATYPMMAFSAMVVTARSRAVPALGAAYHILLLEATGKKLEAMTDTHNGHTVRILRPTEIAIDNEMMGMASELVMRTYPQSKVRYSDATVVPETFKIDDEHALYNLALNAGLAVTQELAVSTTEFRDINLVEFVPPDSRLHINIGFTPTVIPNVVNEPMRSDVLVSFTTSRNKDPKYASVNSGDREQTVNEVSGFIDLVPTLDPMSQAGIYAYPGMQMAPMPKQRYAARLVLTNIASNFAYTPGGVLLALITALQVGENNNWTQAFRPLATRSGEIDMRDIGALNIEANIQDEAGGWGSMIDTKSSEFDLKCLGAMVGSLVRSGMMVSLDCPLAGPQSWYTSIFRGASNGVPSARELLLNAANQLTNGNFSQFFPMNTPMFTDVNNRVHLGNWTDVKAQKRDIRDFDQVAVCNLLGRSNPAQIREWTKTWVDTATPLEMRLSKRESMIKAMSGDTANFTGFAERVTFSAPFVEALAKAAFATKLAVNVTTPLSSADLNYQRPVADYVSNALMSAQPVFQPGGFGNNGGNMGYQNQGNWRWGA